MQGFEQVGQDWSFIWKEVKDFTKTIQFSELTNLLKYGRLYNQ